MRRSHAIFTLALSAALLAGASPALAQGISQLQQFTSTTTPVSGITQTVYGKPLILTGLTTDQCLTLDSNRQLTTTPCSSGGASFGQAWEINAAGYLAPTTTLQALLPSGFVSQASSTIGNGTATGGLTVNGGATTTLNAYFASNVGIGTTTPYRSLSILNSSSQAASPFGIALADTSSGSAWSVSQPAASIDYVSGDGSGVGANLRARFGVGMTTTAGSFSKLMFQLATSSAGVANGQLLDALTISQGSGYPRVWIGTTTSTLNRNFEVVGFDVSTTISSQGDASIAAMNTSQTNNTFSELGFDTLNTSGTEVTTSKILGVHTSHSAGAEGGDLVLLTKTGGGTLTERVRVDGAGYLRVSGTTPTMMGNYSTGYASPNLLTVRAGSTTFSSSTAQISLESFRTGIAPGDMLGSIVFKTLDTQLAPSAVSLGTTTVALVGIAEGTHNGSTNGTSGLAFYTTSGAYTNFAEKVRISGAGNLGIATTSPWATLSVEGISSLGNQAIAGYFTATSTTLSTFSAGLGIASTSPAFPLSVNDSGSDFYVTSTGKVVGQDTANSWNGIVSPTHRLTLQTGTTTTWTASTTGTAYSPYVVAPFSGTVRQIYCLTDASFLGVNLQVNGSNATPSYFVASTTPGNVPLTAGNTFTKGQKILMNVGTTTTSSAQSISCTMDVTEN